MSSLVRADVLVGKRWPIEDSPGASVFVCERFARLSAFGRRIDSRRHYDCRTIVFTPVRLNALSASRGCMSVRRLLKINGQMRVSFAHRRPALDTRKEG
jgi:hypothetical protein